MNDQSKNRKLSGFFIGLGVLLIVLGALFLVDQAVDVDLGHFGWPFFVVIPGLAVSGAGFAVGGPTGERITPLGAAGTMTGLILLYQNAADHFESWAYGIGMLLEDKNAVSLGAGGSVDVGVARTFAREGWRGCFQYTTRERYAS